MRSLDRSKPGGASRWASRTPIWIFAALAAWLGASPPEVVKIRVPSEKISKWFPPGSDLQVLPSGRFDELVEAARGRPPAPRVARILKARHAARWESGTLVGRSELVVGPATDGGPHLIVLDPWSPALEGRGPGAAEFRATSGGQLALKVEDAGPSKVEPEWTLRARPGSDGLAFALALPELDVSGLVLDLPGGLVPEAAGGPTIGPEPGPSPGRSTWRLEAARGRIDLRLRDASPAASRPGSPRLWLEGRTTVDLNASPVNWKADWTLDESPGSPQSLTIDLDAGLELVDVEGPRVASFRSEPAGPGSRVAIRLGGEGSGSSPLTIRAICQVPPEGTWPIPSARARDATWTGGRTTVRFDPSRVFQSCLERSGRRVPPRSGDQGESPLLVFESGVEPGPVADLTFRKPTADATVEVRGLLRLGDDIPRVEVALTWSVERGRLLSHAADLPPGWRPDRVVTALGQTVPWQAEPLGNGGSRVFFGMSQPGDDSRSITLILEASARLAGVTGPLDLPRVRPAPGPRLVDEVWVAVPDPKIRLKPIAGRGLAWIDPPDPPPDDVPTPWLAGDLPRSLSWRWISEDAEARIDRFSAEGDPRGAVKLDAFIGPRRLDLEWSIEVDAPRGDLRSVPVHVDEPPGVPIAWRSGEPGGPFVEARPIVEARRASFGFPAEGQAWELLLSGPSRGRGQLRGRCELPWTGRGRLPLLTLPDRYQAPGQVAVVVDNATRVKVDAPSLTPIEPSSSAEVSAAKGEAARGSGRTRLAAMFGYRSAGGRLQVETTPGEPGSRGGLVREAFLVSEAYPGAGMRHRLTLKIAPDSARSIELAMPRGGPIDRLRRDGVPVVPILAGGRTLVEVPAPSVARPTCTLTVDYRTDDDPRLGRLEPRRLLPACSLPCLSFAWEIVAPEPWTFGEAGPGLEATDLRPPSTLTSKLFGVPWSPWGRDDRGRPASERSAMLLDLDKVATEIAEDEANLGDWLVKLDAGHWPLVVDRLAIRSAGWGPGSRIDTSPAGPSTADPVRAILQPMGLAAYPLEGMILITSRGEVPGRPGDRESWSSRLRAVPSDGSDPTDRFQSAARWRGEPTPRALAAGESAGRLPGPGGWHAWRVVSGGWPAPGAWVMLVDERADRAWGWLVASIVLAGGFLARGFPASGRAVGLATVGIVGSIGLAWTWPEPSSTWIGLSRGAFGVMAFWLGRSYRPARVPTPSSPGEMSTTTRRSGFLARVGGGLLVVLAVGLGPVATSADLASEPPILALLPFDGPADPASKPDHVVLLLKDFERLQALARPADRQGLPRVTLRAANHRVDRGEPGLSIVESAYEVEASGAGPASWTMPVGPALELSATVGGRPAPLAISADGLSASIGLDSPGTHQVRFRRSVPLSHIGRGGERARVPINRAAFARVEVAKGGRDHLVEIPGASGALEVKAEAIGGGLGPLDVLEVRWSPEDRPPSAGFQGPVDAAFLWDARPAGDLIRIRLAHGDPDGSSTIRLALEPGLVVRRHSIPNLVGIRREGTASRPEWVAQVAPPLPKDVPIEVDLWRPAVPGASDRRWPEVEVPTSGRFSGLLGFRRPADWSGRLVPEGGLEAVPEASFAKSWGLLPDDGLALAGAVRFGRPPSLEISTRPTPPRRSVRTTVLVDLGPGRLNATIEAVLSDRQGRSFELELGIPAELRVVRVSAAGLLDWREIDPDRLRLQFDGSEVSDRNIRIDGFLPVLADSAMSEVRSFQSKIPWPRWADPESGPGTLVISGPTRFQFEPGEGVVAQTPTGSTNPETAFRSFYRVEKPPGLTPVRWSSPPAKVAVSVLSELAIDPESLNWTAAVSFDIAGGPADSLNWNLPTEWANGATLELEGLAHRLVSEAKGVKGEITHWTILPASPLWGHARLILRSKRPLRPGREFNYPQIAPLAASGRGSVGRYDLAIANVSGRPLEVAGSPGLQPIDASRIRPEEFPSPSRSIDRAYHVTGERWALRVRVGREGDGPSPVRELKSARVALARLDCELGPGGETWGRARYDLQPGAGPFLPVRLPEAAEIPWAAVDGQVEPALRDGPGRWLIPLGDRRPRRVTLSWHLPGGSRTTSSPEPLACPTIDQPGVPTVISVHALESAEVVAEAGGSRRLNRDDWEVEDTEEIARRVVDSLADLDRTSLRDREQVLDDLIEIELHARSLARGTSVPSASREALLGRIQGPLAAIADASESAGLDELIEEARARVGLARSVDDSVDEVPAGIAEVVRPRRIGLPHYFRSPRGLGRPPGITWRARPTVRRAGPGQSWTIAGVGILLSMAMGGLVAWPRRRIGRPSMALGLFLVLSMIAWEPVGIMTAIGLFGLGWMAD